MRSISSQMDMYTYMQSKLILYISIWGKSTIVAHSHIVSYCHTPSHCLILSHTLTLSHIVAHGPLIYCLQN